MRVIIAGAGRAGLGVAVHLRTAGHDVTVIDRDPAVAARAFEQHGIVSFAGDATEASVLKDAEVERADVVVAMLRRDADNLAVALLARAAGARRAMVRMRDAQYRGVYVAAGIEHILSEIDVLVAGIAVPIEHPAVRHAMLLGKGVSVAFELEIPPQAAVVGSTVGTLATSPGFPHTCVFAGMYDADGSVVAPRGSSVVRGGMTLLLVAAREELEAVVLFFLRPEA